MTRTDVHAPSKIKPEDYYFVAMGYQKIEDLGSAMFMKVEREKLKAHMESTGGWYSKHQHGGNCHICGAWCIYTAIFYHMPTNTYIRTGMDCAEKLDMGDAAMFRTFRKSVQDALQRKAGKAKAKAMLEAENLSRAWEMFESDIVVLPSIQKRREQYPNTNSALTFEENVSVKKEGYHCKVKDIVETIVRYGDISEKQLDFLKSLINQFDNAEQQIKNAMAERKSCVDCPTGDKVKITGKIVKFDIKENAYGVRSVMTVKDDNGFKVWGTKPSALNTANEGDRVSFVATVNPSDRDSKFGFFKRPTKVKLI